MRILPKIATLGAIVFIVMFSTVAVAQRLIGRGPKPAVTRAAYSRDMVREIPVFFPQGRLYCVRGALAYQTLYPVRWERLSPEDAVKMAAQSVEDACLGGEQTLCKEYRSRLSKLRLAIRGCF